MRRKRTQPNGKPQMHASRRTVVADRSRPVRLQNSRALRIIEQDRAEKHDSHR